MSSPLSYQVIHNPISRRRKIWDFSTLECNFTYHHQPAAGVFFLILALWNTILQRCSSAFRSEISKISPPAAAQFSACDHPKSGFSACSGIPIRLFRLSGCALIRLFRALTLIRLVSYPLNFNFLFSRYPLISPQKSRYPLNPGDPPPPLGGGCPLTST